jgi:hypothetical protein
MLASPLPRLVTGDGTRGRPGTYRESGNARELRSFHASFEGRTVMFKFLGNVIRIKLLILFALAVLGLLSQPPERRSEVLHEAAGRTLRVIENLGNMMENLAELGQELLDQP